MHIFIRKSAPLIWALITWYLTSTPQLVVTERFWLQDFLMAFAHFTFLGMQASWLYLAGASGVSSLVVASLFGAAVELNQLFVPGRSADPADWALDTLGALTFLFILKKLQSKQQTIIRN